MSKQFTMAQTTEITGTATRYFFLYNPSDISVPSKPIKNIEVLEGRPIRQHLWGLWSNAEPYTFSWTNVPLSLYSNLLTYAQRNRVGDVSIAHLYDGNTGEFPVRLIGTGANAIVSGTPIKVLEVTATPILGSFVFTPSVGENFSAVHRMSVEMKVVKVY